MKDESLFLTTFEQCLLMPPIRIRKNRYLPGLIVVPDTLDIATAVIDLEVLIVCATADELQNRIYLLPI